MNEIKHTEPFLKHVPLFKGFRGWVSIKTMKAALKVMQDDVREIKRSFGQTGNGQLPNFTPSEKLIFEIYFQDLHNQTIKVKF